MSDDMSESNNPPKSGKSNPTGPSTPKPAVTTSLEKLEWSIGELGESLSVLIRSLNPILTPEDETESKSLDQDIETNQMVSELAGILTDDNARIRSVIFRINQLIGRLEI